MPRHTTLTSAYAREIGKSEWYFKYTKKRTPAKYRYIRQYGYGCYKEYEKKVLYELAKWCGIIMSKYHGPKFFNSLSNVPYKSYESMTHSIYIVITSKINRDVNYKLLNKLRSLIPQMKQYCINNNFI